MKGVPSSAVWLRGAVVAAGSENVVYQYDVKGEIQSTSGLEGMAQVWDCCEYHHDNDIVGASIALAGAGDAVHLLTAVGRGTIKLSVV